MGVLNCTRDLFCQCCGCAPPRDFQAPNRYAPDERGEKKRLAELAMRNVSTNASIKNSASPRPQMPINGEFVDTAECEVIKNVVEATEQASSRQQQNPSSYQSQENQGKQMKEQTIQDKQLKEKIIINRTMQEKQIKEKTMQAKQMEEDRRKGHNRLKDQLDKARGEEEARRRSEAPSKHQSAHKAVMKGGINETTGSGGPRLLPAPPGGVKKDCGFITNKELQLAMVRKGDKALSVVPYRDYDDFKERYRLDQCKQAQNGETTSRQPTRSDSPTSQHKKHHDKKHVEAVSETKVDSYPQSSKHHSQHGGSADGKSQVHHSKSKENVPQPTRPDVRPLGSEESWREEYRASVEFTRRRALAAKSDRANLSGGRGAMAIMENQSVGSRDSYHVEEWLDKQTIPPRLNNVASEAACQKQARQPSEGNNGQSRKSSKQEARSCDNR